MALYLLGDIQDMCKYHLSYGSGAVCGNIGNNDTAFFGSSRIDNVVSGSQYTDIFQFGQGSHVEPQNNPAEQKHAERMIQLWGDKFKK